MDLPETQSSRHARESKSGIPENCLLIESEILEILMEEFGNPKSMAEFRTVLYSLTWDDKAMLSPQMPGETRIY